MKKKTNPPVSKSKPRDSATPISDALRAIIRGRGLTAYRVAKDSGVSIDPIQRFLDGERGLVLTTVDKVAAAFRLRLVEEMSVSN
jgi:DNA-binding phage protein